MARAGTERERLRLERRGALLTAGAALFARDGFAAVTTAQLGAAVGVSGPAVYRHFESKQALLAELLVGVSRGLRDGGTAVQAAGGAPSAVLAGLVEFHVEFALSSADVIRVQDRDLSELAPDDRARVRRLQREYAELWVATLGAVLPTVGEDERRLRVHAVFGLINSTPHSVRRASGVSPAALRTTLVTLALAALTAV
ncbi:TetR/AcrR family transcriptional regulator [Microbacterium gorillae]|uniref:TetR/AcrR family transcriptional regulator n=1 Tax=Microbacterium gorillae TaxID=1231063 RepID=UPI000590CD7F|nr:TetR/AcrR family transcriptional regulator [Microbacterium gorillae]